MLCPHFGAAASMRKRWCNEPLLPGKIGDGQLARKTSHIPRSCPEAGLETIQGSVVSTGLIVPFGSIDICTTNNTRGFPYEKTQISPSKDKSVRNRGTPTRAPLRGRFDPKPAQATVVPLHWLDCETATISHLMRTRCRRARGQDGWWCAGLAVVGHGLRLPTALYRSQSWADIRNGQRSIRFPPRQRRSRPAVRL